MFCHWRIRVYHTWIHSTWRATLHLEHCFLTLILEILQFVCLLSEVISIKWPAEFNLTVSSTLFLEGFGREGLPLFLGSDSNVNARTVLAMAPLKSSSGIYCSAIPDIMWAFTSVISIKLVNIGKYHLLAFIFILCLFMNQSLFYRLHTSTCCRWQCTLVEGLLSFFCPSYDQRVTDNSSLNASWLDKNYVVVNFPSHLQSHVSPFFITLSALIRQGFTL